MLSVLERKKDFLEVERTFTLEKAREEANRCLNCGICGACYRGTERGWGCPWMQKMGGLARNNYCSLCMECVKNCPYDNIGLYARPFSQEHKLTGLDEAWKAFIMLTLAGSYSVVLLGPFGAIKNFANLTETMNIAGYLQYTASVWFLCLLGVPLLHGAVSWLARLFSGERKVSLLKIFLGFAAPLVPFGLLIWIAFSVPLLMINGAYIVSVISDPFGWGWNLFGTAHVPWSPVLPEYVPLIQLGLILLGFLIAFQSAYWNAEEIFTARRARLMALIPIVVFLTAIALFFGRLYAG